ncbi:DUF1178 family protein [Sphingomonas sp. H39-1-10]|uniref:DUF1178 family protein n=1 Tax=Sphingomonas TaxID=13687 RepID=UPI00088A6C0A|nr:MULTISPECIES: DUF1178 family protein [Sphingomonas]MDF0489491.1 DUF1178 family protein [Sphingomonas pollutisoli]SDA29058.1 hypothetical protein SAMN03159340_02299 [Sphingomonas sp. NFR15]
MIVFDLRCARSHVFEAWFGSSDAYEDQRARGLLSCPVCGDAGIAKAVMAPNVAPKGNSRAVAKPDETPTPAAIKAAMKALAEAQARVLEKSEWVGTAFPERARAMHAGDLPAGPIHGQTTLAEAKSLIEEGVPVAPLPLPVLPPDVVN